MSTVAVSPRQGQTSLYTDRCRLQIGMMLLPDTACAGALFGLP